MLGTAVCHSATHHKPWELRLELDGGLEPKKVGIPKSFVSSARGSLHVHGQLDGCRAELQARGATVREPCGFTGASDVRRGLLDASNVPRHIEMETRQSRCCLSFMILLAQEAQQRARYGLRPLWPRKRQQCDRDAEAAPVEHHSRKFGHVRV